MKGDAGKNRGRPYYETHSEKELALIFSALQVGTTSRVLREAAELRFAIGNLRIHERRIPIPLGLPPSL